MFVMQRCSASTCKFESHNKTILIFLFSSFFKQSTTGASGDVLHIPDVPEQNKTGGSSQASACVMSDPGAASLTVNGEQVCQQSIKI